MSKNTKDLFVEIIKSLNINIITYDSDFSKIESIDMFLRKNHFNIDYYYQFIDIFNNYATDDKILKIKDTFKSYYYIYKTTKPSPDGSLYLSIGPLINDEVDESILVDILKRHNLIHVTINELYTYFNHIPMINNLSTFEKTLIAIASNVFNRTIEIKSLSDDFLDIPFTMKNESPTIKISTTIEEFYSLENSMLDAISIGNSLEAIRYFEIQSRGVFRPRFGNPLRISKNRYLVFNTLCRKSIEKSGVHPIYIDNLSANFANEIEKKSNISDFNNFYITVIQAYCNLVNTQSIRNYHPLIKQCLLYINKHVPKNLSLSSLAHVHNVSPQYLSTLFYKEVGTKFTTYYHNARIEYAKELLLKEDSNLSLISETCGYNDPSYFTKVFKKHTGKTPSQYRDEIE